MQVAVPLAVPVGLYLLICGDGVQNEEEHALIVTLELLVMLLLMHSISSGQAERPAASYTCQGPNCTCMGCGCAD